MIDALVGTVIMVAATTALVLAVEFAQQSMSQAGRHPLNDSERVMLKRAGLADSSSINKLSADLMALPRQ